MSTKLFTFANTTAKTKRGGKRVGAGRPKETHPERLLKIRCTDEEYARILTETTPRGRVLSLLTVPPEK